VHLMSDPQDVPLTTTRLILEPLVVAHAHSLYPLLQDERLYTCITYRPQDPPTSVGTLAARALKDHGPDRQCPSRRQYEIPPEQRAVLWMSSL
jgi:hypothetical protein